MPMMGEMTFFLGLRVNQSPSGIFINQSNYVNEILKKYGLNTYDIIGTPMDIKYKLDLDQIGTPVDATKYHSMIVPLCTLRQADQTLYMLLVYVLDTKLTPLKSTSKSQSLRDLPKDTPIDRLEVLRYDIGKRSKVRMGRMPTKTELTLEITQQGAL
nr:hypothetical protein [Tanacetum cinerariifolium]